MQVSHVRGKLGDVAQVNAVDLLRWPDVVRKVLVSGEPGKPNQNTCVERFNRTFRDELLDQHLFTALDDVCEAVHWWMIEYNEERPHDALNDLMPLEARQQSPRNSTYEMSP